MNTELLHQNDLTISSREIYQLTGKTHKHVLADCDKLNEKYREMLMAEISAMNYKAENGQYYREYKLNRMQTFDLMTGYDKTEYAFSSFLSENPKLQNCSLEFYQTITTQNYIKAFTKKSCNCDYQNS